MIKKSVRLFRTLKYLKLTQLFFFVVRRKFPARCVSFSIQPEHREGVALHYPNPVSGIGSGVNNFCFLNIEKNLSAAIDWAPADVPRLWRYNLHYFDYLRQDSRSDAEKVSLIEQWIEGNPQGSVPGWEPFTASLRIVNWVFYLTLSPIAKTAKILQSLYVQVLWLEKNDERHILANHYFENLKALAFAGAFFKGKDAERWRRKAVRRLLQQLEEQTLADGGHYERSPQYHGLMLENYLDLFNLASRNQNLFSREFAACCLEKSAAGLRFMEELVFPDGSIPLFNDSAFGASPALEELQAYFQRLTGQVKSAGIPSALIDLPDTGLFGYRSKESMVIFDAGDIGPGYQPGHTHCDMLSYELMWDSERIVVDSGVCEYEPGAMRRYVRSTRAHNTVSVDGADQSEVWGEFRVARRAAIIHGEIALQENAVEFVGAYRGFPVLDGTFIHHRRACLHLKDLGDFSKLEIDDRIDGLGRHRVETFIHLHPDVCLEEKNASSLLMTTPGGQQLALSFAPGVHYGQEQGFYCPEFGVKIPNIRIILMAEQELPAQLTYSITKIN